MKNEVFCLNTKVEEFEDALWNAGIDFKLNLQNDAKHTSAYLIMDDNRISEAESILFKLNSSPKGKS